MLRTSYLFAPGTVSNVTSSVWVFFLPNFFGERLKGTRGVAISCQKGSYEEGGAMLRRLYAELEKLEPKNAYQFRTNAQLFSRICGKDVNVLEATAMFAEKAASIDSTNSASMAEVGHQVVYQSLFQ